jgi:hypothetical protein
MTFTHMWCAGVLVCMCVYVCVTQNSIFCHEKNALIELEGDQTKVGGEFDKYGSGSRGTCIGSTHVQQKIEFIYIDIQYYISLNDPNILCTVCISKYIIQYSVDIVSFIIS